MKEEWSMSEYENRGELVLHPHVSGKLKEIEALRRKLSVLIEEHEGLLYGEREVLLAKYNRDVGYLEHELFLLKVEVAELRRRIAILQAEINLGETITVDRVTRLDEEIQEEFETARAEIEEREHALRQSAFLLDPERLMKPEDVRELKTLYRRLCQRCHPDVGGKEAERWQQIWSALQHAYRAGDLDLLRALAETANATGKASPTPPDCLDSEIERLRSLIERQGERITVVLSEPPFSYREKLADPQWIRTKQEELEQEIATRKEQRVDLQRRYGTLLPPSGPMH